jgi:hypothetical protein
MQSSPVNDPTRRNHGARRPDRMLGVFAAHYVPTAVAAGCLLGFPALVAPEVVFAMAFALYLLTVAHAAAGPGETGIAGLLHLRRHRLRHTAEVALAATTTQACLLGLVGAPSGAVSGTLIAPQGLAALLALHLAAGWLVIGRAACTLDALRRAFAADAKAVA